jgi:hypothetical protein
MNAPPSALNSIPVKGSRGDSGPQQYIPPCASPAHVYIMPDEMDTAAEMAASEM